MAQRSILIVHGLLFITLCQYSRSFVGGYTLRTTDACRNSGSHLVCDRGSVLSISDITCVPYNYTCPEYDKIVTLCNGQRSCATIGLGQQFYSYCRTEPDRAVIISFSCIPGPDSPCRTNICSDESQGLLCNQNHLIHILKATCSHGKQDCRWRTYHTLYTSCEGHSRCAASGLKMLVPKSTCGNNFVQERNIFVDYICVVDTIFDDTCNGNYKRMAPKFGIIKSPGFPRVGSNRRTNCFWELYSGIGQEIMVTVHLSYSRTSKQDCQSLQVQYVTCKEKKVIRTPYLCRMQNINKKFLSCGHVYIINKVSSESTLIHDQYLISYQVRHAGATGDSYIPYRGECTLNNSTPFSIDQTFTSDAPLLESDEYPTYGLYTHSSQSDSIGSAGVSEGETKNRTNEFDPDRWTTVFKIVVINVFLFIIIIALLLALIYICMKYKKADKYKFSSRRKKQPKRDDSTQLRTLCNSSNEDEGINEGFATPRTTFSQSETTATIHSEPPYASLNGDSSQLDSGYTTVNRTSPTERGGVSTFMQPKDSYMAAHSDSHTGDDPYASYSSLADTYETIPLNRNPKPERGPHLEHYPPDIHDLPLPPPPPPPPILPNSDRIESPTLSDDIEHYIINDDDYAIVRKPKRKNTDDRKSARLSDMLREYEINPETSGTVSSAASKPQAKQRPPYPHLHRDGFLPAHRCLLEPNAPCSHVGNGNVSAHPHPSHKRGETMI